MEQARTRTTVRDQRATERDEVHYRARAFGPDAQPLSLLIVNISAAGLMARSDRDLPATGRIRVALPGTGFIAADIRWSLGGRIGAQFDPALDLATYYEMLAAMLKRG